MDWTEALPGSRLIGEPPLPTGVTHDSRLVKPGFAFVAVPGSNRDGHDYIDAAFVAGAALAVVRADAEAKWSRFAGKLPLLVVEDSRAAMGIVAATVYGTPSRYLRLVGVTGTDGKTTTTHLTAHVLDACGVPCGYLSSVGFDRGGGFELNQHHMTTLEATDIQSMLADALDAGKQGMVVEASSEGLVQSRLEGCELDVAVFRNLTRDHLDFHGTMEAYRDAKGLLFKMLNRPHTKPFPQAAVINADDDAADYFRLLSEAPTITYGVDRDADVTGADVTTADLELRFTARRAGETLPVRTKLMVVHNALAALAVALSQDIPFAAAAASLETFAGIPGRLEAIDRGQPFRVIVDIASTPASMEHVLKTLRPATKGQLWVVFGAAGGRDPARRDGIGRVAGQLADRIVLTNEDPRTEDPELIIEAIATGLREAGRAEGTDFLRIPDRREAIRRAFENAAPGDTVLLAGKATETTIIFADHSIPWDERAIATELLGG